MATNKDISILQGSTFSIPVRWMNGDQIIRKPITGISSHDVGVFVGLVFAAGAFVVNWYYKYPGLKVIERRVCMQSAMEGQDGG